MDHARLPGAGKNGIGGYCSRQHFFIMFMQPLYGFLAVLIGSTTLLFVESTMLEVKANDSHIIQLLRSKTCVSCDLRKSALAYAQLNGSSLENSDLSYSDLSQADLEGSNLRDTNLDSANLTGASLRGANLSGAVLTNANLDQADLTGAVLTGRQLVNTKWFNAYGVDLNKIDAVDIYLAASKLASVGDFRRVEYLLSVLIQREPEVPTYWLERGIVRLKMGNGLLGTSDLRMARTYYSKSEDTKSAEAINSVLSTYKESISSGRPAARGNGLGTKTFDAIKKVLPMLMPLAGKLLLPTL